MSVRNGGYFPTSFNPEAKFLPFFGSIFFQKVAYFAPESLA